MIQYNKAYIKDGKLILDFQLEDKSYYNNCGIEGVRVDTTVTYGTEYPYYEDKDGDYVEYTNEIYIADSPKELFIITPIVHIDVPEDAPCGADIIDKAVVYDNNIILGKSLDYIKGIGDTCEVPRDLIDFILRKYALDASIATCNYSTAIKYWGMLNSTKRVPSTGCGCYGR